MVFTLKVDRSIREYAANSASLLTIDPAVSEKYGLKVGDLVHVSTIHRAIIARVGEPEEEDRDTGLIRLDRFQRQSLKVRLFETVEVNLERERITESVLLQPAVDLTTAAAHHIEHHLKEEMLHSQTPVMKGGLLFIHFHHSVAGTLYKVLEVEGEYGVVGGETVVILDSAPDSFSGEMDLDITFSEIGGLDREIRLVQEIVQLPLQFPSIYRQVGIQPTRGIIFFGPPGTGKTLLARAIANEVNAQFFYINGPEIIGTTYGESEKNIRKIFAEATHHAPSIIFIDEIDVIAPKRGETGSHSDTRVVTQLLSLMDGMTQVDGVIVVATTNRIDALDVALRRPGRFDREIYIGPPDEVGRLRILNIHSREMPLSKSSREYLEELAVNTHGFVGADIMELCREAGLNALRRNVQDLLSGRTLAQLKLEKLRVEPEDFRLARKNCHPSASRETLVVVPNKGFEVVGGRLIKEQLNHLVVYPFTRNTEKTSDKGYHRDGIILSGPSGIGKSLIIKAVAKEAGVNLIFVSGPELFTKWLGESEESLRHVFRLARQLSPCIIFFDQLDALAPRRGRESGSQTSERVVNQLISELDSLEGHQYIISMAATNRIDLVDESLLQPGRFGTNIKMGLPDQETRAEILGVYLHTIDLDDVLEADIQQDLAKKTAGFTGAELRSLVEFCRLELSKKQDETLVDRLDEVINMWKSTRYNRTS